MVYKFSSGAGGVSGESLMSNDKQHYTGIGARDLPGEVAAMIGKIAAYMARRGYVLRSGGAEGSSAAFEKGCDGAGGKKVVYLPWRGFNGNNSPQYSIPERAFDIVKAFEPAWNGLSQSAKSLKARYALTILGQDLKNPSACVICYTQGGKQKGGTGQALRLAQKYNVPVFDIGLHGPSPAVIKEKLAEFLKGCSLSAEGLEL